PPAGIAAGVPTFNQLKDAYVSGKNSSIVENVRIDPSDAAQQIRTIKSALDAKDFSKEGGAAKTLALLDRQESKLTPTQGKTQMVGLTGTTQPVSKVPDVTMGQVDDVRYQLRLIAKGDPDGPDGAAAKIARGMIDDWEPAAKTTAGDMRLASAIMQDARRNYAIAKGSNALDKQLAVAELQAAGAHSGL